MKRRVPLETELRTYAADHEWSALITANNADDAAVFTTLDELLYALPGRRRVRALELASLVEARFGEPTDNNQAALVAIAASLRADYRFAFLVDPSSRPGPSARPVILAATPRSGNTLVQRLFADITGYSVISAPAIADIAESEVAGSVFVQVHAPNDRHARKFVAAVDADVITIARHPLDVLLSVLHFNRFEPQILDWLDGAAIPDQATLHDASPTSEQFLRWATGKGAARLLAITHRWWREGTSHRLRYEDLVTDTPGTVGKLLAELGIRPQQADIDIDVTADQIRAGALLGLANHHRWRSTPNGWSDLLPIETAIKIQRAHRRVFEDLDYTLAAADPLLDESNAHANWLALKR